MNFLGSWLFQISGHCGRSLDILLICPRYDILNPECLFVYCVAKQVNKIRNLERELYG